MRFAWTEPQFMVNLPEGLTLRDLLQRKNNYMRKDVVKNLKLWFEYS